MLSEGRQVTGERLTTAKRGRSIPAGTPEPLAGGRSETFPPSPSGGGSLFGMAILVSRNPLCTPWRQCGYNSLTDESMPRLGIAMTGTRLYQKKSQAYLFISLYGLLAIMGSSMATLAIRNQQNVSGAVGFMIVFGLGMAVNALIKSRKAQVAVHEEFLDVNQSRTPRSLRYRNMTGVSRPDKNRLIVTLREGGAVKNEVIWTKELDPAEVELLYAFLTKSKGKGK